MTVQAQEQQAFGATRPMSVRGLKKWAIGFAAIAAAATGIGVGVAVTGDAPRPTVITPASQEQPDLGTLHTEANNRLEQKDWAK